MGHAAWGCGWSKPAPPGHPRCSLEPQTPFGREHVCPGGEEIDLERHPIAKCMPRGRPNRPEALPFRPRNAQQADKLTTWVSQSLIPAQRARNLTSSEPRSSRPSATTTNRPSTPPQPADAAAMGPSHYGQQSRYDESPLASSQLTDNRRAAVHMLIPCRPSSSCYPRPNRSRTRRLCSRNSSVRV